MKRNTTSTRRQLFAVASICGLVAGIASAQTDTTTPHVGVQKIGALQQAQWRLAGAFTDRPGGDKSLFEPRGSFEVLYDNRSQANLFMAEVQPHRAGDDASLLAGACLGGPARIMSVEFGMYVNPGPNGEADFDAYCVFYDNVNHMGSPVNTGFLGGFFIEVRDIDSNVAYTTGPIDLTPIFPGGIPLGDEDFFVDLRFYEPGSVTQLSSRATPIFSGGGPAIGSSMDVYWPDANDNGQYDESDARSFGGPPFLANFYLSLAGLIEEGCAADFNADGVLNSADFFAFLDAYFSESIDADFNYDGQITSQDFFDYLTAFFTGCP